MEETIKRQRALTLVKRMETPGWFKIAVPVASIIGGFLFSAIFLMAAGGVAHQSVLRDVRRGFRLPLRSGGRPW